MMKKLFLLVILSIFSFDFYLVPVSAEPSDYVVDQACTTDLDSATFLLNTTYFYQSFMPSINNINQIELYLYNGNVDTPPESVNASVIINDEADENTPLVNGSITGLETWATQSFHWCNMSFSMTLLTPGTTYYILVECTYFVSGKAYGWMVAVNDPYSRGRASTTETNDFGFKTYYDSVTAAAPEICFSWIAMIPIVTLISIYYWRRKYI